MTDAKRYFRTPRSRLTPIERMLVDLGLTPMKIFREDEQDESSLLGSGGFAVAYEVLDGGKRRVARVTLTKDDADNFVRLNDFRKSLGKYSKHVRRVYSVDRVNVTREALQELLDVHGIDGEQVDFAYIVVVEYLEPLSDNVKESFWGRLDDSTSSFRNHMIKDKSVVKRIVSDATQGELKVRYDEVKLVDALSTEIVKRADNLMNVLNGVDFLDVNVEGRPLGDVVDSVLNSGKFSDIDRITVNRILTKSVWKMRSFLTGNVMPMSNSDVFRKSISKTIKSKEMREFLSFLDHLQREYGIEWSDIHEGNVMQRPGTKTWVLSDPGDFR